MRLVCVWKAAVPDRFHPRAHAPRAVELHDSVAQRSFALS